MNFWPYFEKDIQENNLIWIGEIHGIKENYHVYKYLIDRFNINQIALEYPVDLESFSKDKFIKYQNYLDGRFSQESLNFFIWLIKTGKKIICFDDREYLNNLQQQEEQMANYLIKKYKKSKTLVITGDFHSQLNVYNISKIKTTPMAALVKNKVDKLLTIGISYAGGKFYNYDIKKINKDFISFDKNKLPFGEITKNNNINVSNKWWFHAGIATPVNLLFKKY